MLLLKSLVSISLGAVAAVALGLLFSTQCSAEPQNPDTNGDYHTYHFITHAVRPYKNHPTRDVVVYTPPGYDDPANSKVRYPVVYLLHGAPGNPHNFFVLGHLNRSADKLIDERLIPPVIFVAADGNFADEPHGDSEWLNSPDGRDMFETYLINEIIGWTDQKFRTIPTADGRMIGGVSEGGYAAANLALKYPTVFSKVLSLSGYFLNDGSGWARPMMGHDLKFLAANSPITVVLAATPAQIKSWQAMHFYLGAGAHEKHYTDDTQTLGQLLASDHVDADVELLPGKHTWLLWNQLMVNGLVDLMPATPDAADRLKALPNFVEDAEGQKADAP
jgi:enterochelin esterase-like enzyme